MALIEKTSPGSFCWMELHAADQDAAKQFYSSLFGWDVMDFPMGPAGTYTIFTLKGKDCSAACTLMPQEKEHGVPPHWMLYIATDNVDESSKRVTELGGTVIAGPFDVMDKGRMSIIQDPTGAMFCLWQPKASEGIGIAGENGAFCWADHNSKDRETAKKFYGGLFGWTISAGQGKDEAGYLHIENGKQMIGGMTPPEMLPAGVPPHWLIYYMVADCDASTNKASSLGAKVIVGPMTIEGAGRMTILADPQSAVFAVFQSMM
jgi:predicted enzyme related to lactoylglutathione lyase